MKSIGRIAAGIFSLLTSLAPAGEVVLPPKESLHLFLLAGQSNMAGRGLVEEQDKRPHPRVLMLSKEGHGSRDRSDALDKPSAGVGLGKTFAQILAEANPAITIGSVPARREDRPSTPGNPAPSSLARTYPWDDMAKRVACPRRSGHGKAFFGIKGRPIAPLNWRPPMSRSCTI